MKIEVKAGEPLSLEMAHQVALAEVAQAFIELGIGTA